MYVCSGAISQVKVNQAFPGFRDRVLVVQRVLHRRDRDTPLFDRSSFFSNLNSSLHHRALLYYRTLLS
jgi:hypothetical protein